MTRRAVSAQRQRTIGLTVSALAFMVSTVLLAIAGLTACATAPPVKTLSDGRSGAIAFQSVTLTTREFLRGLNGGTPVVISGNLRLPREATERVPAVVILHGSNGISPNMTRWADELLKIGVATFVIDSFSGRGIRETFTDQSRLSHFAMMADAFRALELLATHPQIDPIRIGIMGFSKGGIVILYASVRRFQQMNNVSGVEFAAYIAFYPMCNVRWIGDEDVSDRPIRIFHGEADDQALFALCRDYVERLRGLGKDAEIIGYPGAHHGFDAVGAGVPQKHSERQNYSKCVVDESKPPPDLDAYTRTCRSQGVTLGYDPHAHTDASRRLELLLSSVFRLDQ